MVLNLPISPLLSPTAGEREHRHPTLDALLSAVFLWAVGMLFRMVMGEAAARLFPHTAEIHRLLDLLATSVTIGAVIAWVTIHERRGLYTVGLVRARALSDYAAGALTGAVLLGLAVGLCVWAGLAEVTVNAASTPWWWIPLFLAGFLVQGLSEELCQCYLLVSLSRRLPLWGCVAVNAALFAGFHLFNPSLSPIALVNLFLFGALSSIMTIKRGSVWMAAACHSLWNFAQGNLLGLPVSGITRMPALFCTDPSADSGWQRLITGGAFGIEGGLAATAVLLCGLVGMLVWPRRGD